MEEARAIKCPRDGRSMERVSVGGVEVDRCGGCGAMWFDALELDRVLAIKGGAKTLDLKNAGGTAMQIHEGRPQCPVDHSTLIDMSDLKQPHVRTDACTVCGGVLLDAGELSDLAEFSLGERWKLVMHQAKH
jgi:Zn-finger nucleic acid-binding protein